MTYRNLDEFLIRLEQADDIITLDYPDDDQVSNVITDHAQAIWFEGAAFPVAANIFGSARRMAWSLRLDDLEELNQRLAAMLDLNLPQGMGGLLSRAGQWISLVRNIGGGEQIARDAQAQQITMEPDLTALPLLKRDDAPGYITMAQVITVVDGGRRVDVADLQVQDATTMCLPSNFDYVHDTQPAAVVLGGDPAAMWSGFAPLPDAVDPYLLAGWLRNKPIQLTQGISQPIRVPANAEFVIEGIITGRIFQVSAITHRKDAVFPMSTGERDLIWIYKAVERLFLPVLKIMLDEVVDMNLPVQVGLHNLALVSIDKTYHGQAQKVMYGLWGLGQLSLTRTVIVVDADVDVQDISAVMRRVLAAVHWGQDILTVHGANLSGTDRIFGQKVGIDATRKADHTAPPIAQAEIAEADATYSTLYDGVVWRHAETESPRSIITQTWHTWSHTHVLVTPPDCNLLTAAKRVFANVDWQNDVVIRDGYIGIDATRNDVGN